MDRRSSHFSHINFSGHHGGALRPSDVKRARPFSARKSMHVVLKTTSFRSLRSPKNFSYVQSLIKHLAKKTKVSVEKVVLDAGSIHLITRCQRRENFFAFTRAMTGLIARRMLGAEKGSAHFKDERGQRKAERFWLARPFTRIVQKGRANFVLENVFQNHLLQAVGFVLPRRALISHPFFSSA